MPFLFADMVIGEYGATVWNSIETCEWKDSEFYSDEAFFDMVDTVVKLPAELDSKKVDVFHCVALIDYLFLTLFCRSCICMQSTF